MRDVELKIIIFLARGARHFCRSTRKKMSATARRRKPPGWAQHKRDGIAKRKERERLRLPAPKAKPRIPWYIRAERKKRARGTLANTEQMSQKDFARVVASGERIAKARERRTAGRHMRISKGHSMLCADMSAGSASPFSSVRYRSMRLEFCDTTDTITWHSPLENVLSNEDLDAVAIERSSVMLSGGVDLVYAGSSLYSMCFDAPRRKNEPRYFSVRDVYDIVLKFECATRKHTTHLGIVVDREHVVFGGLYSPSKSSRAKPLVLSIAWNSQIN